MVVESTEIQFKTSSRDKLTGELIGGILVEEFS